MAWQNKKKPFRVLVIDGKKEVRQALADYYAKNLQHQYAQDRRSVVCKVMTVSGAESKIIASFLSNENFGLIVLSNNFPESEKNWLIKELSYSQISILFISVPLSSLTHVMQLSAVN